MASSYDEHDAVTQEKRSDDEEAASSELNNHEEQPSHIATPPVESASPSILADPDVKSSVASPLRHSSDVYHHSESPADDAPNPESVASPPDKTHLPTERLNHTEPAIPVNGMVNLFVRNVAKHVQEHQLIQLFSKYGKVHSSVVVRDPHSRECRGFGFVKMCTEEGACGAIESLRDFEFEGRTISVERAKRSSPHQRTPGAYMGIDRRIRDRYAGMKRAREYDTPFYAPPYGGGMGDMPAMRRGNFRGRYEDMGGRQRYEERSWHPRPDFNRPASYDDRPSFEERQRVRRRDDSDIARYAPPVRGDFERDGVRAEREPPVPRESADDYI